MPFKSLALASDGSDHARVAALLAGRLSARLEVPVHIVSVVPSTAVYIPGPAVGQTTAENILLQHRDLLIEASHAIVEEASNQILEAGGTVGKVEVVVGDTASEIVAFASRQAADCIVMGRRGLGNVSGLFAGSVSHKVGQIAKTAVMTTA